MSAPSFKCTELKSSAEWANTGEKNLYASLKACDRRPTKPTQKKKELQGLDSPQEFTAGYMKLLLDKIEEQPQRNTDYLAPIFHLMRTEFEQHQRSQDDLIEQIVHNCDSKIHSLQNDYINKLNPFHDTVTRLSIGVDQMLTLNKYEPQLASIEENLNRLFENQQNILDTQLKILDGQKMVKERDPYQRPDHEAVLDNLKINLGRTPPNLPNQDNPQQARDEDDHPSLLPPPPLPAPKKRTDSSNQHQRVSSDASKSRKQKQNVAKTAKNGLNIVGSAQYSMARNNKKQDATTTNYHPPLPEPKEPKTTPFLTGIDDDPVAHRLDTWMSTDKQKRSQDLSKSGKRKLRRRQLQEEDRERNSILLFNMPTTSSGADYKINEIKAALTILDEISTSNMESRGCNVKIEDIKGGTRIHAWKGQEKIKPFKLEFKELSKATQIKKAIREAGFMGRRSLSKYGLYKPTGNNRIDKESRKKMPDTFVNESTTKAQRDEIKEKNRYKNSQAYKDMVDVQKFAKERAIDFSKYHYLSNGDIELLPQQE